MVHSKNFLKAAVVTGLIAGTLDLAGAVVNSMISFGRIPYRILEYIASGAFGNAAMNGRLGYNLLGTILPLFYCHCVYCFILFYISRHKIPPKKCIDKCTAIWVVCMGRYKYDRASFIGDTRAGDTERLGSSG